MASDPGRRRATTGSAGSTRHRLVPPRTASAAGSEAASCPAWLAPLVVAGGPGPPAKVPPAPAPASVVAGSPTPVTRVTPAVPAGPGAHPVVLGAALGIGERLVGDLDAPEERVGTACVGVDPLAELAVGGADLRLGRVGRHPEHLVVAVLLHERSVARGWDGGRRSPRGRLPPPTLGA